MGALNNSLAQKSTMYLSRGVLWGQNRSMQLTGFAGLAFGAFGLPALIKGLRREFQLIAMGGPGLEGFVDHPVLYPRVAHIHPGAAEACRFPDLPGQFFRPGGVAVLYGFIAIIEQEFVEVDLYGANLGAVAAEGGGIAQVFPFAHVLQMRGDDGADGAAIGGSIAMAADILIDGAGVETGSAADAVEAFPGLCVGEDVRAAVVEEDEDHLFGAVGFAWLPWAGDDGIIDGYALTGAIGGKQGPEEAEVGHGGDHFFEPGDDDMCFWEGCAEAGIAFVLGDGDAADVGDEEVGARDADLCLDIFFSELLSCHEGELFGGEARAGV